MECSPHKQQNYCLNQFLESLAYLQYHQEYFFAILFYIFLLVCLFLLKAVTYISFKQIFHFSHSSQKFPHLHLLIKEYWGKNELALFNLSLIFMQDLQFNPFFCSALLIFLPFIPQLPLIFTMSYLQILLPFEDNQIKLYQISSIS